MTKTLNLKALGAVLLAVLIITSALLPMVAQAADQEGTIKASSAKLREKPSSSSKVKVLATLKKGAAVTIKGTSGSYYKVTASGKTGYVRKTEVTVSSGSTKTGTGLGVIGHVKIDGLTQNGKKVDHDVAVAKDNKYYMDRDVNGKKDVNGAIFLDFRNQDKNRRRNLVLYGHNMKDGSMFAALHNYGKGDAFTKYNKVEFEFLGEKRTYEIVACGMVDIKKSKNYIKTQFKNDTEFVNFLNTSLEEMTDMAATSSNVYKKQVKSGYTPSAKQDVLTLSTCVPRTMKNYANYKWIVLCVRTA